MSLSWQQLHALVGIAPGEGSSDVYTGIGALDDAGSSEVSFLGNPRYEPQLVGTSAGVVLVPEGDFSAPDGCRLITVANPSGAFSKLIDFFQQETHASIPGVSSGAHISDGVVFDSSKVQIGPGAVLEAGVVVGDGTIIGSGCLIGRDVVIGQDCLLHPGAIIRERCILGNRVILQPGCVIGSDGYGFDLVEGRHQKVPQVGIVEIQDDVEIGANSCLDRARFGRTIVGEGTKVDNLVQIAHNVRIGKHCLVVAQSGVAGSSKLGNYVTIAAQAGVSGHLEVGDQVILTSKSGLFKSITKPDVYMGTPARPMKVAQKKMAMLARLPKLQEELREMKKKLEELSQE
jgi:UDP-3-O-[3-hydroxymyristoyl] glucosamine N-acyltransferase